ncbi:unnamed protein product [Phytomonas sp. EM1]|nr:unnamed protein product [Phytomonas sp. EM1]|eukprot:CCW65775.1 unnamed protein product [Phytomonas sp. isolate EM1]
MEGSLAGVLPCAGPPLPRRLHPPEGEPHEDENAAPNPENVCEREKAETDEDENEIAEWALRGIRYWERQWWATRAGVSIF